MTLSQRPRTQPFRHLQNNVKKSSVANSWPGHRLGRQGGIITLPYLLNLSMAFFSPFAIVRDILLLIHTST